LPGGVISRKRLCHFGAQGLNGTKTGSVGVALLAGYGKRTAPRPWTPPSNPSFKLRDVGCQINSLPHSRSQTQNRLQAVSFTGTAPVLLPEDEQEAIAVVDRRIGMLTRARLELTEQNKSLSRHIQHLCAATGADRLLHSPYYRKA